MTNETAAAATSVTDMLCEEFSQELTQGQEIWEQAVAWVMENGIPYAVRLIAAIVILVIGWLVIKLIVHAVGKAVCAMRCNAPLTADWKEEIDRDFKKRHRGR